MIYTQLRAFHAVAAASSFTKAADALHVTQPTLSAQVKALEEAYGVELFERRGRGIAPTELGPPPAGDHPPLLQPGGRGGGAAGGHPRPDPRPSPGRRRCPLPCHGVAGGLQPALPEADPGAGHRQFSRAAAGSAGASQRRGHRRRCARRFPAPRPALAPGPADRLRPRQPIPSPARAASRPGPWPAIGWCCASPAPPRAICSRRP